MPAVKGKESLEASFKQAEEALIKLDTSPSDDPKQLNLATSLIHDLEKKVMRLTCPEERDECRTKLEDLQQRLHDASGESNVPEPSHASAHPGEVVGDIDDLFSGMNIADAGDSTKEEFVPQAIPGRRYMKVVRTSAGGKGVAIPAVPSPAAAGAAAPRPRLPRDAQDIAGQGPNKEDVNLESDDENVRYKPQRNIPSSPLRVLLPDMPLAEAAVAAAAGAGAASHGSADSTMARGGGGDKSGADSDSDDDSITSPDNYNEAASFRK